MSRKISIIAVCLPILALLTATALASTSVLPEQKARTAAQGEPVVSAESAFLDADNIAAPGHWVAMQPQTDVKLLKQEARRLGPHTADAPLHLTVSLKLRKVEQLKKFLREVQNPQSPFYHQFLTPRQFTLQYGPSEAQVERVVRFLKQHGIRVENVTPDRLLIHTEATAENYEHAFSIRINDYSLNGRRFFSTEDKPRLPANIADLVQNIAGLDNAVQMHPMHYLMPLPAKDRPVVPANAAQAVVAPAPSTTYFNPLQTAKAYDWPSITNAKNGSGVAIAILTAASSNLSPHDYKSFWAAYGLPDHDVNIIPVDGDEGLTTGTVETLLDMEYSGAMGPGATLNVYVAADAQLSTFLDTYDKFTTDDISQVMTTSWGAPESAGVAKTADAIFMKAAAQGISMFSAAGDHGTSDGTSENNIAEYPSVSLYITAANGTRLSVSDKSGTYASEVVWNDADCFGNGRSATGGAISRIFKQPDWQHGPGVPNTGWRMNSGLSMNASCSHPYLLYANGAWNLVGGTSAVSPQLAGLFAIAVWQNGGVSLGQSNKLIYNDANSNHYAGDFRDVTEGCNGKLPDGTPSCAAKYWDHPTGWGSPQATNLLSHLTIQGPSGILTGTVTDAASGASVAGASVTVKPGGFRRVTGDDGNYSMRLAVGDYTATVQAFGYKQQSAQVSIAKGNTTTQDFSLQAAPTATLSGRVTDGSGRGYGLYADIEISTPGYGQIADVWSNPQSGAYHVSLPKGFQYTLKVTTYFAGYDPEQAALKLSGDTTKNFVMKVSASCQAPGYAASFGENFNGSFPPKGWSVTNDASRYRSQIVWKANGFFGDGNYTGGSGNAATADSNKLPTTRRFDTSLISPTIDVSSLPADPKLQFLLNYQHNASSRFDALDVYLKADGGAWSRLAHFVKSKGGFYSLPGVTEDVDLAPFIPTGTKTIQIRWRYSDLRTRRRKDWYAQIDDVVIGACAPTDQGLIAGQVSDANTGKGLLNATVTDDRGAGTQTFANPADPNLPKGYYFLFSKLGGRTITVSRPPYQNASAKVVVIDGKVNGKNFPLEVGRLTANANGFNVQVMVNNQVTKTLTLGNTGGAAASWSLHEFNFGPVPGSSLAPAAASAPPAGTVIRSIATGMATYGLGVDHDAGDLWIGSPAVGKGDNKDHRFLFDGTDTGEAISTAALGVGFMADMAYDDRTGTMWQVSLPVRGIRSCIFEFDPRAIQWTGKKICPVLPSFQYALAYDPTSNTWYSAGSFTSVPNLTVYHFDSNGKVLDTKYLGLRIIGLTYNSATGHLFVLNQDGALVNAKQVVVLDTRDDYARVNSFDIKGLPMGAEAAGFGHDCDGHLWVADRPEKKVFEVVSGETGWCADKHVRWLETAPASGTIATGAQKDVTLTFNGTGQRAYTTSKAQLLLLGNVPYGTQTIPVTVTWEPQPVDLALQGTASPSPVKKGKVLVYTLTIANKTENNHGAAEQVILSYSLPTGASFVPSNGSACQVENGTVSCELGTIAEGGSKTVAVAVKPTQAGKLVSSFEVAAREPDSDPDNNTVTVTNVVTGTADVSVSTSGVSVPKGTSATMHLSVGNAGPDSATNVTVKVTAGAGVELRSAKATQGSCTAVSEGSGFSCDLGDIASGATGGVDITAFGANLGIATVTAQATTSADDPNQDNNVATAEVTVTANSGGGGGSFGWLGLSFLLVLAGAGVLTRSRGGAGTNLRSRVVIAAIAGTLLAGAGAALVPSAYAQPASGATAKVIVASKFMRTEPLHDMRWNLPPVMQRVLKNRPGPFSPAYLKQLRKKLIKGGLLESGPTHAKVFAPLTPEVLSRLVYAKDPALQRVLSPRSGSSDTFTQPIVSFDGLGHTRGYDGAPDRGFISPDPNIAVGAKYVVQAVDSAFAVFDKSDGSLVLGPVAMNSLWAGFGGECEVEPIYPQSIGGPSVTYDQLAERWIISRVTSATAPPVHEPTLECVAVSQTNDPTGAWYLYAFPLVADRSDTPFLTYSKWALWRGSYLASWEMDIHSGVSPFGFLAAAFDRAAMLKGDPNAQMVEFTVQHAGSPWGYFVLPADLDGHKLPPAGSPGYFMGYSSPNLLGAGASYALLLWQLNVNWTDPSSATFTGPTEIPVAPFTDFVCGGSHRCIRQKGTGPVLNSVSDQLMYRLAYRNFGDREAMVVNQTVGTTNSGSPPTGVRWYELDTSSPGAGDWSLAQQGTFAPADGKSRWIGSIAMDHAGDMALGYSLSSPSIYPAIAYTGRKAGDPAGKMTEPETVLQAGGGAELDYNRSWGEYSSMAVAPFDGCTFWYTNEYFSDTVAHHWSTHIGAFKFSSCTSIPVGTLSGTVTAAASGDPLDDATITLTGDIVLRTDDSGHYQLKLPAGSYTATASDFGYSPDSVSVTIGNGDTATQDFQLALAPKATLSGKVSDGSGHGYRLYAHIEVASPGFGKVTDTWTDPKTGKYHLSLPEGFDYTIKATAYFTGYETKSASLTFTKDATQNFVLTVGPACEVPGYSYAVGETFNGEAFPPTGWSVVNAAKGVPVTWAHNVTWSEDNFTGGSGFAAMADSYPIFGTYKTFDTRLVSPPIPVSTLPADPVLHFKLNYQHLATDALDVDISVGGGDWTTMDHVVSNRGAYYELPGTTASIPLAGHIPPGAKNVRIRWRYYDLYKGLFGGWYAQIDDVSIGACTPLKGSLIEGQVQDANTGNGLDNAVVSDDNGASTKSFSNPKDSDLPVGYYFLFSDAGKRKITASRPPYRNETTQVAVPDGHLITKDFVLDVGKVSAAPDALSLHAMVNNKVGRTLTIHNEGSASAGWRIKALNVATSPRPVATGPFATPSQFAAKLNHAVLSACAKASESCGVAGKEAVPGRNFASAAGTTPGAVIATFSAGIAIYGLGVDHNANDLWLSSPAYSGVNGDRKLHRFLFDGTNNGDTVDTSGLDVLYMADMAYDDRTGMFWQMGVTAPNGNSSCIYELNPRGMQWTGRKICPSFPFSQRALAYDPVSNTWYASNFQDLIIYHFDDQGGILDSQFLGLPIIGLAYNPGTGHLFALTSGGTLFKAKQVVVLDAKHDYSRLSSFNVQGLTGAGAGLGYDCDGHLWVSDSVDSEVFEIDSGETGWCSLKRVPWLTAAPAGGSLEAGADATLALSFDGSGQKAFTSSQTLLQVIGTDTPYQIQTIPVNVTWDPQPVDLVITGEASSDSIEKGGNLVYTLTVTNKKENNHGQAQQILLSYVLPAGVSFIPSTDGVCQLSDGTVSCGLGSLGQEASKTVVIAVTVQLAGELTSTFTATAKEPQKPADDNTATIKTLVIGTADIGVSTSNISLKRKATGTVQFAVANAGPDAATGVKLKLSAVGSSVTLQSATTSAGSCAPVADNAIDCAIGEVAAKGMATVAVKVLGAEPGNTTVTGRVTTSSNDPNPDNDLAQATVTVTANSGGGGSFGWLMLAALLGLTLVGGYAERRRRLR